MGKKPLEKNIIDQIFQIETKKTVGEVFIRLTSLLFVSLVLVFIGSIFLEIINENHTFDLFFFINDDVEVVKKYLADNLYLIYLETPKLPLILLLILFGILLVILLQIRKNFGKIKNRVKAILKHRKNN